MKTYDNKIMKAIVESFNNDSFLTLERLENKMRDLDFLNFQAISTMISSNNLAFRASIDGKQLTVFMSYLPECIAKVAEFKQAYAEFKQYQFKNKADNFKDYEDSEEYGKLEHLYGFRQIKVQFLYVQEED